MCLRNYTSIEDEYYRMKEVIQEQEDELEEQDQELAQMQANMITPKEANERMKEFSDWLVSCVSCLVLS